MNKKIYNEDLVLNLIVNGDKITPGNKKLLTELNELDQAMRKLQLANAKLELDRRNLSKSDTDYAAKLKLIENQMKANDKQMDSYRARMMEIRKETGLAGMTINQLRTYLKVLEVQLNNTAVSNKKLRDEINKQIAEVNILITQMKTGAGRLSQAWTQLARDANKYSAAIGWISVIVYGISNAVGNLIDRLTGLGRKLSEVMKTTGLTREEAARLKREFDLAATPTKTDDLLAMAKIAGRLGIEGFDNIKRFTSAVDVLYTALGDDLNLSVEDTAEKVGKLVNAFRVTDKMPIDEALLRTGSLLNQLDKSSVASAGTILEYMTRLSSLGTTANYPMEQLAGLAAALETVNIPAERGSTALRNIIDGLGKHADKFSRIMGITLEEYKRQVETDINGVFLKLIELTSKGDKSIMDTVQSMGDFEISGVRVAEVFGALAKNLDVVRTQQDIATESFKSSASVMSEYNIIINDFKGSVEGQQKRVRALADEFNLSLRPAAFSAYKMWVDFLYILRDMSRWMYEHSNLLKGLVALYIAWKATAVAGWIKTIYEAIVLEVLIVKDSIKAHIAHNSILVAWQKDGIRGAITALRALWATMLANPMTSIITILGAIAGAFFLFKGKIDLVTEAMANMMEDMNKQRSEMAKLFDIVEQTSVGTDRHNAAIKALNEVYGKYLPNLLTEKDGIDAVTTARRAAIKALEDEILLKHENDSFAKIQEDFGKKRIDEAELLLKQLSPTMRGQAARGLEDIFSTINSQQYSTERTDPKELGRKWLEQFGLVTSSDDNTMMRAMNNYLELIQKQMDAMAQFNAFKRGYQSTTASSSSTKTTGGIGTGTPAMSEEEFKKQKEAMEVAYKEQLISLRNSISDKDKLRKAELQAESGYTDRLIGLQLNYNKEDKAALTDLKLKKSELQQQMENDDNKHAKNIEKMFDLEQLRIEAMIDSRAKDVAAENKRFEDEKNKYEKSGEDKKRVDEAIELASEVHRRKLADISAKWDEEEQKAKDRINKEIIKEIENFFDEQITDEKERYAKGLITYTQYIEEYKRLTAEKNSAVKQLNEGSGRNGGDKNADDLFTEAARIRKAIGLDKDTNVESNTAVFDTENYDAQLIQLKSFYEQGIINHEEYENKKTQITQKQAKQRFKAEQEILGALSDVFGALGSMYSAQKQKELEEAGNNATKKEEIERKYARKQQSVALGQAVISGALGVMRIIEAKATGNAILDAILKPILIAAQLVTTGIQISTIKSQQFAKGKYPVIGADDGQTYWASWTGNAQTGIYTQPSLIAEKGPEMVIDYPTLRNIKMNNPRLIETVMAYRVPQYANGMYNLTGMTQSGNLDGKSPDIVQQTAFSDESLARWEAIADRFENMEWNFNFTEFEKIQKRRAIREKQSKL
jgi:TP901 family phage tail tape measure protein